MWVSIHKGEVDAKTKVMKTSMLAVLPNFTNII